MQQRNFILFIVLSVLVLVGWTLLQSYFWPPPPPKDAPPKVAEVKKELPAPVKEVPPPVPAVSLRDVIKKNPLVLLPGSVAAALATNTPPLFAAPALLAPEEARPPLPIRAVTIGGEGYVIEADLTTQGAGVTRLTLTQFQEANWLGEPVPSPLDLIQRDVFQPSYLMYHFPDPNVLNPVMGLGEKIWELEGKRDLNDGEEVRFVTTLPGLDHVRVTKIFTLRKSDYHLDLALEFKDLRDPTVAAPPTPFRYQLTGAHGLPIEGVWYTAVFRNAVFGLVDPQGGLWRTLEDAGAISAREGSQRVPGGERGQSFVRYAGVVNQYFGALIVVSDEQAEKGGVKQQDIVAWARATQESFQVKGRIVGLEGDVILFRDAVNPQDVKAYTLLPRTQQHIDLANLKVGDEAVLSYYAMPNGRLVATWIHLGHTLRPVYDDVTVRVNSEPVRLKPGEKVVHNFLLYHGPVKTRLLGQLRGVREVPDELVDRYTDTLQLSTLTDYPSAGIGWVANKIFLTDLIIFFTKIMHTLLYWLHFIIPNYGLAIICLTVIVRGLMYPISRRQALFSIKMQELAPEMKRINERYQNDPAGKTQATMELYRRHNVHPLGSCLPLLLQMPIFLGLYFALQESIHFRLAPFLWIDNLAAPDMLVWWSQRIPMISDPDSMGGIFYLGPFLNLLPLIAVVLMMAQQQMMMPPPTDEQQAAQQKMMKFMTIFFGVLFYKVPSGLCLYFIASSLWGLAERQLLPKKKPQAAVATAGPSANGPQPRQRPGRGRQPARQPEEDGVWQKVKAWWADVLEQARKK